MHEVKCRFCGANESGCAEEWVKWECGTTCDAYMGVQRSEECLARQAMIDEEINHQEERDALQSELATVREELIDLQKRLHTPDVDNSDGGTVSMSWAELAGCRLLDMLNMRKELDALKTLHNQWIQLRGLQDVNDMVEGYRTQVADAVGVIEQLQDKLVEVCQIVAAARKNRGK
jgi:hypothetical protein